MTSEMERKSLISPSQADKEKANNAIGRGGMGRSLHSLTRIRVGEGGDGGRRHVE